MSARAWVLGLTLTGCTGGLFTDKGNDFPCDFSQPQGARDAVCSPGEVCGVDNVCRVFHYEGPQFEASKTGGGAPLPVFASTTVLHPGLLNQPILALSHRNDHGLLDTGALLMGTPGGQVQAALVSSGLDTSVTVVPFTPDASMLNAIAVPGNWAALVSADRAFVTDFGNFGGATQTSVGGPAFLFCERLRTGDDVAVVLRGAGAVANRAAEFGVSGAVTALDFTPGASPVFHPLEARYVPASPGGLKQPLMLFSEQGFALRDRLNVDTLLTPAGTDFPADLGPLSKPTLRHDVTGSVWAFTRLQLGRWTALSTWRFDHNAGSPTIARLWNDCSPCLGGRIVAFAPVLDGAAEVQVLCATQTDPTNRIAGESLSLTRVVGSAAIDETEECLVEPAEAPFALSKLNLSSHGSGFAGDPLGPLYPVQDDANGGGVLLGGINGQVWSGPSFTEALPLFLERTPVAFGTFVASDGGAVPVALTDHYLAVPRSQDLGFQVIDIHRATSAPLAEDVVVSALMGQGQGWGLLSSADVALVAPADGGHLGVTFGPRLVDARGTPALSPFFGEAATDATGNPISFIMTANDSVYFTKLPADTTTTQDVLDALTPQLTPAAGAPIRSMTLERSAIGTDGINRVRGYLIAGRQLFLFTLGGTPQRWTATPILLQGGEPVEVWMDNPLGGLGRVGYRDGEVFSLPGGFLLVNQLPHADGGEPPQVLDYENLGGWPVAMTNEGLYEAHWDESDGTHLDNRFPDGGPGKPMDWRPVVMPDGSPQPWLGKNARLQVVLNHVGGQRVFTMLVYTDDQVLQFGSLTR